MSAAQPRRSPSDAPQFATVWVVNSDAQVRQVVERAIQAYPLHLKVCLTFSADLRLAASAPQADVILINLTEAAEFCFSLLPEIRQQYPDAILIFLSQSDDIHLWAEAIQLGAYEFLPRSVECDQLGWVLQGALWTSKRKMADPPSRSVQPMFFHE